MAVFRQHTPVLRLSVQQMLRPKMLILRHLPERGLEPLRIAPPDPKSGASANFATPASLKGTAIKP